MRGAQTSSIEVHALSGSERRLLLEMLASERCGEDSLNVANFGRDLVAEILCDLRMSQWVSGQDVVFTHYGRYVAESLALRLMHRCDDALQS